MARIQFLSRPGVIEVHRPDCAHLQYHRRLPGYIPPDEFLRGDYADRDQVAVAADETLRASGYDPLPVRFKGCSGLG